MNKLEGMNIVVLGSSGVLGQAFTRAAVAEGANCILGGRSKPPFDLPFISADVTCPSTLKQFFEQLEKRPDRIDVALNFTGVHHSPMQLGTDDIVSLSEEWTRVLTTNLTGAFLLTAGFARLFARQRHGHLIHLCSNASRLSLEGSHAYVASKHGLEGLVKSAAAQLARFGVRVNGLAPGTVETPLNRHLLRDGADQLTLRASSILAHTPTKRFATVEGVIESALALCIPQRHLTGNIIFCDDGYAIEGHSWPEGTRAVYDGPEALADLLEKQGEA